MDCRPVYHVIRIALAHRRDRRKGAAKEVDGWTSMPNPGDEIKIDMTYGSHDSGLPVKLFENVVSHIFLLRRPTLSI